MKATISVVICLIIFTTIYNFTSRHVSKVVDRSCNVQLLDSTCDNCITYKYLLNNNLVLSLNFDDNIHSIENSTFIVDSLYSEVQSHFKKNVLMLKIIINRTPLYFQFKPGKDGTFIVHDSEILNIDRSIARKKFNNQRNLIEKNCPQVHMSSVIGFNGIYFLAPLRIDECETELVMGINFIKSFNWIIDYNKQRVYIKKNNLAIESNINSNWEINVKGRRIIFN